MWTDFLPKALVGNGPTLIGVPLEQSNPDFPDYLRGLGLTETFQEIVSDGGTVFSPTIAAAEYLVPVIGGSVVERTLYAVTSVFTFTSPIAVDTPVRFYTTSQLYYKNTKEFGGYTVKLDYYGSKYKDIRNSIHKRCPRYTLAGVTVRHENAPDRLAQDYYKDVDLWWVIMLYNGFIFPEQIQAGATVKIPDFTQLKAWLQTLSSTSSNQFRNTTAAKVRV